VHILCEGGYMLNSSILDHSWVSETFFEGPFAISYDNLLSK
jgi:hypothetical protein